MIIEGLTPLDRSQYPNHSSSSAANCYELQNGRLQMGGKNYGWRGWGEREKDTKERMELIKQPSVTAARGMRRAWCVLDSSVSCKASRASKQEEKLSCMHEWQRERERPRES
jgi:hypothetical protein